VGYADIRTTEMKSVRSKRALGCMCSISSVKGMLLAQICGMGLFIFYSGAICMQQPYGFFFQELLFFQKARMQISRITSTCMT
jgi:hypothetical protein